MRSKTLLRVVLLLVLAAGIAAAIVYRDKLDTDVLKQWLETAGWWAPVIFMAIYSLGTVFFLPGILLTAAGGIIFGPYWGTVL